MSDPVLFDGFEPTPAPAAHQGRDARRTARQKALIDTGTHPTLHAYDMRKWWPACDRFTEVSGDA